MSGVVVYAYKDESIDSLLRRFKRVVENSKILSDLKKYEVFEKPSVKKKRKKIAARKRELKRRQKEERFAKPKNQNFRFSDDRTQKIYNQPKKYFNPRQGKR